MAHLCACVYCSFSLSTWDGQAMRWPPLRAPTLSSRMRRTTTTTHFESDDARYPCTLTKSRKYSNDIVFQVIVLE